MSCDCHMTSSSTGFCELERIGDKLCWWMDKVSPQVLQFTLYSPNPESVLYQEMLNHKTWQIPSTSGLSNYSLSSGDSDSDFEEVGYYQEGSRLSSYYYSDEGSPSSVSESCIAPETTDVSVNIHPAITITNCTPIPPTSPNEIFLSLIDTPTDLSLYEHVPLPPEREHVTPDPVSATESLTPDTILTDNEIISVPINSTSLPTDIASMDKTDKEKGNLIEEDSTINVTGSAYGSSVFGSVPLIVSDICSSDSNFDLSSSTDYMTPSPKTSHQFHTNEKGYRRNTRDDLSPEPEPSNLPRVGSWMNLRGPLVEMLEFSSPNDYSNKQETSKKETEGPLLSTTVVRSVPWSAVSSLQ